MFCSNCGNKLEDNVNFCPKCGAKVGSTSGFTASSHSTVTEPSDSGTFTDPRDEKVYKTVKIGKQIWMAENLAFDAGGSTVYENNPTYRKKYGRLYTWSAAKSACPKGWHLPSHEEWRVLIDLAFGGNNAGEKLKAKSGWDKGGDGTDDYGFAALPGGFCYSDDSGDYGFDHVGYLGTWWTSSTFSYVPTYYSMQAEDEYIESCEGNGLRSVRCIKDTFDTFTDPRDGKVYKTVKIGEQIWMAENLAYNAAGSKCYSNDESNGKKYGRLYDWNSAMKACPKGWHLPSYEEWQILVDFAGGEKIAGKKLKAKDGWKKDKEGNGENGTDDFDFFALPGGISHPEKGFVNGGFTSFWWSSTEDDDNKSNAWSRWIGHKSDEAYKFNRDKSSLCSVRYIKD